MEAAHCIEPHFNHARQTMDLIDRLQTLASRSLKNLQHMQTEEATKNALIMPFIQALGFDVFNPLEVVPEFTADVGTKKGEKVDYALLLNGEPVILIECKSVGSTLNLDHASQLYRYFSVSKARFGVLTDGVTYNFYSDLEEPNKMDSRPFLVFSLEDITDSTVDELKKFAKEGFNLEEILSNASELKFTRALKKIIVEESAAPSDEMVRLLSGRIYSGRFTQAVRDQFTGLVKGAFQQFVDDRITERLTSALERDRGGEDAVAHEVNAEPETVSNGIVTTEEEIEAFQIVRAILSQIVSPDRVVMRDRKTYCAILLDDTNRKTICRLYFNGSKNYVGLFDAKKNLTKEPLEKLTDIYALSESILNVVRGFEQPRGASADSGTAGSSQSEG